MSTHQLNEHVGKAQRTAQQTTMVQGDQLTILAINHILHK
jgi:hypothetical protein